MASYPTASSSFKSSSAAAAAVTERRSPESTGSSLNGFSLAAEQRPDPMVVVGGSQEEGEGFIGSLEVYIHHARDIHNICIYHKQDVYAKICLTSDPEASVSTRIINGGGKNPVFNESLRLDVRTADASLKCEIWMLSRVKNYLEDQLLGFALVPLSEVVVVAAAGSGSNGGRLTQEFSLSSTDLFHSPAGFVQLSLSYTGTSPEVMAIAPPLPLPADNALPDTENDDSLIPCEYTKMEFPDLKIVNENEQMVSEYFGIPCEKLDNRCSESLVTSEDADCLDSEAGVRVVENFSGDSFNSVRALNSDTPPSSVSTNGSPSLPATSQSFPDLSGDTSSPNRKDKGTEGEGGPSSGLATDVFKPPVININIEPEQTVVEQDIIDMYMKSMQQFTESLAKMKLPMDVENSGNGAESANSGSEQKVQASKGKGSRVFYGSRAFF